MEVKPAAADAESLTLSDFSDSIVQTIREPLLVLDQNLKIKMANRSFYNVFKTTSEQTIDHFLYSLGSNEWDIPALRSLLVDIIPTNTIVEDFEVDHLFPVLGRRIMLVNARQLSKSPAGPLIFLAIDDVTERRQTQRELESKSAALERSNADLEQFAYVASHDLQEPLRMVASFTRLLGDRYKGRLDPEADEFIGYAIDGAVRMQKLINDLLAYSRVSTQGSTFGPVDMGKVWSGALSRLSMAVEENNATVTNEPLPMVAGDESQLIQLCQNLIGNAIKFRSKDSPAVHIGVKSERKEWVFCVSDNGIGFDSQYKDRVFIIFERLHGHEVPGTGIGLALCKKIAERHGGRMWVDAIEGAGSKFFFSLPMKES